MSNKQGKRRATDMANGVAGTGVSGGAEDGQAAGVGGIEVLFAGPGHDPAPTFEELREQARKLDGERYIKVHTSGPAKIEIKGNQLIVTQGGKPEITYLD